MKRNFKKHASLLMAGMLAVGSMVKEAEKARELLKKRGYNVSLINARFVKPFDEKCVMNLAKDHKLLVTIEENVMNGGFGEQVLKFVNSADIDITVDELITTVAGSESVNLALEIACNPGDEVLVLEPFYTNYNTFAFMNGLTLKAIQTDIRNGFQIPDIAEFEKAITDKTKAVIIN